MKMVGNKNISKRISVVALLLLISVATAQRCSNSCRIRFCFRVGGSVFMVRENPVFLLRPATRPQGAFPCLMTRTGRIIQLRNVLAGEASVSVPGSGDPFVPISEFESAEPRFQSSFFSFGFFDFSERDSVIRRGARGNQREILRDLCVTLPIRSHELLRRNGSVRRRVTLGRRRDCVGFQSRIAELDIELRWSTANDFNIRLIEPSGFQINRENPRSPSGGLLSRSDSGANGCVTFFGTDRIRYLISDTIPSGGYILLIDNINECSPSTEYRLRVTFRGRTMIDETDVTSRTGSPIVVRTFEIP